MMWRIWKYTGWPGWTFGDFRKWFLKNFRGGGWLN